MRKLSFISVLVVTAVIATACLGRGTPTSTPQPQQPQSAPTATPQPTSAPLPTPTPTTPPEPRSEPTTDLSQQETQSDSTATTSVADVIDVIWQWVELHDQDGQSAIADPENYVLVLHAEGTFNVKADCNVGHGTYTLEEDRLTLGPIALTKVMCPKGSRSDQFVEMLSSADTVEIDEENAKLIITLKDEAGEMTLWDAGRPKIPRRPRPRPHILTDLVGVVWQWVEIYEPDGQSTVPDPENYLLTLHLDGTFNVKADCNDGNGTYALDGDQLTLDITAITEVYCGDDSLFDLFITMLDNVRTVALDPVGTQHGRLVLTLADDTGMMIFEAAGKAKVPRDPCDWIIDVLWMWERFEDRVDENDIVVEDPTQYTLQMLPDGTFRYKADCNIGRGTYVCCCGSKLTLDLGPGTLADCGPDSLSDEYLNKLSHVAGFVMDEGKLVLNLEADAGSMIFGRESGQVAGAGIDLNTIMLDTVDLPYSWRANLIPATAYDASQAPGLQGLPEHVEIRFGDSTSGPVIYIIPVEPYKQLWEGSNDPSVSVIFEAMQEMLQDPPESFPTAGIPILPFEEINGTNDLAVQGRYSGLGTVNGLRLVGRFVQSPEPVTNEGLRYIVQGFVGDANEYLIAFFYPVTTTALPDTSADVSATDVDRLSADPEAYLEERAATLNGLSEDDWAPNLSTLDAVIASLRFSTVP